jgi:3'-phosphoadenosine 5'-phosphosulfate sulfotransferase (PAPS reductase)/FAD synthetase
MVVMWSGGKDSTAMTHLVRCEAGLPVPAISEKDDLDYPGETDYVENLASEWNLDLTIVTPPMSLMEWISEHAAEIEPGEDIHSRSAALSKECFYGFMEEVSRSYRGIYLGLRKQESRGRRLNRIVRGLFYQKMSGQYVATPLGDWTGLDVMAYMAGRHIDPLPVYRCIGFFPRHRRKPWLVRKSWWLPGDQSCLGEIAWLKHYYPSLYRQMCDWWPDARRMA